MVCLFLTVIFSFSVLCYGKPQTGGVLDPQSLQPKQNPKNADNLDGLMKAIMEALDSAKLTGDRLTPNEEQVESLVMDLSPEKRKVLNEILGLVVNQSDENIYHKPENLKRPQVAKQIEDLLKFLLDSSSTTPSDLQHLKRLIYEDHMTDLRLDPILQKAFNKFIFDTNLHSHEIDHLD